MYLRETAVFCVRRKKRTAPTNSFNTPILTSLAAMNSFWTFVIHLEIQLLSGQPRMMTMKPEKAERPRSLRMIQRFVSNAS